LPSVAGARKTAVAAGLGAALGLAFLSKYAAIFVVGGGLLHLALSRAARRAWTPAAAALAMVAAGVVLAPNLIWNAGHGFATVAHTAAAADWSRPVLGHPAELFRFLIGQVLIFGPIPALALVVAGVRAGRARRIEGPDLMLACFIAFPLAVVAAQALISRANANWAAAAYLPGAVLAGALLVRAGARRWLATAILIQAAAAVLFLAVVVSPDLARALHAENSFKRVRGWRETAQAVLARARAEQDRGGLSAVAVDNRFLFQELAYYGRGAFAAPDGPPLRAWLAEARPRTQAELAAPLTPREGSRVLVASYEGWRAADVRGDFRQAGPAQTVSIPLDARHRRRILLFVGEGLAPVPRPLSGRARPP
jgi:4-amino-4-deoxy-L-arabinose transferase-like glycosyltransferase